MQPSSCSVPRRWTLGTSSAPGSTARAHAKRRGLLELRERSHAYSRTVQACQGVVPRRRRVAREGCARVNARTVGSTSSFPSGSQTASSSPSRWPHPRIRPAARRGSGSHCSTTRGSSRGWRAGSAAGWGDHALRGQQLQTLRKSCQELRRREQREMRHSQFQGQRQPI